MSEVEQFKIRVVSEREGIPTKIEVCGKTYNVASEDFLGEIKLDLGEVKDLRLKDIPLKLCIHIQPVPELFHTIVVGFGEATGVIWETPKYYSQCIGIEHYFNIIKKVAEKMHFNIISEVREENRYFLELSMDFKEDATVQEVYECFNKLNLEIDSILSQCKKFIENILKTYEPE
jgi:hypothetical protein